MEKDNNKPECGVCRVLIKEVEIRDKEIKVLEKIKNNNEEQIEIYKNMIKDYDEQILRLTIQNKL